MADLVVTSKLKSHIKEMDMRMSSELPDALDEKIKELLASAKDRAEKHGKGTIQPYDL